MDGRDDCAEAIWVGTIKYTSIASSSNMFVEAFSTRNGRNILPQSFQLRIMRQPNPLVSIVTTTTGAVSSSASIEFIEESQHHVVTLPPFVDANEQNNDAYPSALHYVHILPLLTGDETSELLQLARNHATENQSWDRQDSSRHVSYPTVDFAIEESW